MIPLPKIALVGRPNVGKSTLFNRICGKRKAITDGKPGSTRDRNYAQASWQGAAFELVDTGGLLLSTNDALLGPATKQAERALDEADFVVLVVDGRAGRLPDDDAIAAGLHRRGKKALVAVNKTESKVDSVPDFSRLGYDAVPISAEHGQGVGDLLDRVLEALPKVEGLEEDPAPRIALVGRPNVGKSSLLNALLRDERAVVSDIPGTTRDSVDSVLRQGEKRYVFVDTAGIRRQRLLKENVDHVSVVQARRSIERSDVGILVLDAVEGLREMDATIAGYLQHAGCGVVLAVNKWDRAVEESLREKTFGESVRDALKFLSYAPIVYVSARSGRGLTKLLHAVDAVYAATRSRVTTGQLNRLIAKATARHAPKAARGNRELTVLYATQVGVAPPTFVLSLNHDVDLHFSYKRYLENQIREAFGFEGAPLVLKVRTRRH